MHPHSFVPWSLSLDKIRTHESVLKANAIKLNPSSKERAQVLSLHRGCNTSPLPGSRNRIIKRGVWRRLVLPMAHLGPSGSPLTSPSPHTQPQPHGRHWLPCASCQQRPSNYERPMPIIRADLALSLLCVGKECFHPVFFCVVFTFLTHIPRCNEQKHLNSPRD